MNRTLATAAASCLLLAGCPATVPTTGGEIYGWKAMTPPRENALGKELFSSGTLGPQLFSVDPDRIERSGSISSLKKEDFAKASAELELKVKAVSADLGFDNSKAETFESTDWQILELKNIAQAIAVGRRFIYQCLGAKSNTFSLVSKSGITANLDASKAKVAQAYGVEAAKVEFKTAPDKPNTLEVKITNPNVCFSYVAATFVDDNDYVIGTLADKSVNVTGDGDKYKNTFELELGQKSNFRSPQFIGTEPAHKPWYRLMATKKDSNGKPTLSVCRQDRGTGAAESYTCKELDDDGYGNWDRPYHIDTFSYAERKYKVVSLNIDAKLNGDKILVKSAKLTYPQYVLRLE